jgi:hypothetical protein
MLKLNEFIETWSIIIILRSLKKQYSTVLKSKE